MNFHLFLLPCCEVFDCYAELHAIAASNPKLREVQVSKLEKEWTIRQEFLTIDLAPFFRSVHQKLAELGEARALVVPTCWGGTPILPNMLVPVYDVSASDAAGLPMMHIWAAYPGLTAPRSPDGFAWLLRKGYIEAEGYRCLDGTTTNERAVIAHHT